MQNGLTVLHGLLGHFSRVAELFLFYYPPLQSMVPTPFMAVWGASEWTLRLPGVLAGVLTCGLLYLVVRQCGSDQACCPPGQPPLRDQRYCREQQVCAHLRHPGSRPDYCCIRYCLVSERNEDERIEGRALIVCAIGLVWSIMSLQDGLFYIPVIMLWRIGARRAGGFHPAPAGRWVSSSPAWSRMRCYGSLYPALLAPGSGGGFLKVKTILSQLGCLPRTDLFYSFYTATSWVAILLAAVLLPLGSEGRNVQSALGGALLRFTSSALDVCLRLSECTRCPHAKRLSGVSALCGPREPLPLGTRCVADRAFPPVWPLSLCPCCSSGL